MGSATSPSRHGDAGTAPAIGTDSRLGDPIDLVAAIEAEPARHPGTTCGVIRIEREDPALGEQVRRALAMYPGLLIRYWRRQWVMRQRSSRIRARRRSHR